MLISKLELILSNSFVDLIDCYKFCDVQNETMWMVKYKLYN